MENKVAMKVSLLKMKSRKVPRAQIQDNWMSFKIPRITSEISFGSKILTICILSKLISEEERKEKPISTILWTTAKPTSEKQILSRLLMLILLLSIYWSLVFIWTTKEHIKNINSFDQKLSFILFLLFSKTRFYRYFLRT